MDDYENIYTYLQFSCQKEAIKQASKYGITEDIFFKMKKEAGIVNWTKAKREYSRELKKNESIYENEIIDENIDQYEIIDVYGNIVNNNFINEGDDNII